MLGKIQKLIRRKSFIRKVWCAVCVIGSAVLGGLIVSKIKSPEDGREKKCTFSGIKECISGIKLVKNHWRKLVAVFLVGWGFGIWAGFKAIINKNNMEVA